MIALVIISGTFAKYVTQYDGAGTAIVANWNVTVKDLNGDAYEDNKTIDLFDVSKVYDLKDVTDFTATGTDDADVANGTIPADAERGSAIVAPGTWGKVGFNINIDASTDVTVEYGINITSLTTDLPLKFSTDGTTWVEASAITTVLETKPYSLLGTDVATKTVNPRAGAADNVVLYWKWDFEEGDKTDGIAAQDSRDTKLGEAGDKTCNISVKFLATQVD